MTSVSPWVAKRCPRATSSARSSRVVVDLAVEDDRDRAVLVEDRLVAGREVDDAQALDAEGDVAALEDAAGVRPAVLERRAHPRGELRVHGVPVRAELSDDSAHPAMQRTGRRLFRAEGQPSRQRLSGCRCRDALTSA